MKLKINRQSLYQSIFSLRLSRIYIAAFVILLEVSAETFAQAGNNILPVPNLSEETTPVATRLLTESIVRPGKLSRC
ncbi:MAG: hypothetical protein WKF90_11895 [Pyrinomonadaceae bacterium]